MISPELLRMLHEIPEQKLKQYIEVFGDQEALALKELLARADEFRAANTTPVFLSNAEETLMIVTCKETMGKKLH